MRRVAGIVVAALAAGAGVIALMLESDHLTAPVVWAVFAPAVGWSFIGTGLYADWRRPENPTGRLMILLGFAWFVFDLQLPAPRRELPVRPREPWARPRPRRGRLPDLP